MKRLLGGAVLMAALAFGQQYTVGSKVGDFSLADVTGKTLKFSALKGDTTVILFIATKCPVSNNYNERMKALYNDYAAKGVKFVFINSNHSEPGSEVAEHARSNAFSFPVYKDPDNLVADSFAAQVTPEAFVLDRGGVIRYHGHIDDAQNEAKITRKTLRSALDALQAGKPVETAETKAFGCTIKRVKKVT